MKINTLQKNIPKGWKKEMLGNISKVSAGFGCPIKFQGKKNGTYPFAKVSDMNLKGNEKYIYRAENYLDTDDLKKVKVKTFPEKTIIFPKVGAALLTNKRRILGVESIVDNNVMGLIPTNIYPEFLYYWMLNFDVTSHIGNGALPSINQGYVEKIEILIPTEIEQKKITDILALIDEDIEETNKIIYEAKKMKSALMDKLFTNGFGHKLFKKTKIGSIPDIWEIKSMNNVVSHVGSGSTPRGGSAVYLNEGVPFIRSQNVYFDGLRVGDLSYISDSMHAEMKRSVVKNGDVLLNITGASIGRACLVPDGFPEANVNQHVCIIRVKEELNNIFLFYFLQSKLGQKQIFALQAGGNREGLNFQNIRSFIVPIPKKSEQQEIADFLILVDKKIETNTKLKDKLIKLKKGLMSDLLSGKVRTIKN